MQNPQLIALQKKAAATTLRYFRRKHNLKRSYIAKLLQVSLSTIDKLEQGKICFRFTDSVVLCEAFSIELADFTAYYKQVLREAIASGQRPEQNSSL